MDADVPVPEVQGRKALDRAGGRAAYCDGAMSRSKGGGGRDALQEWVIVVGLPGSGNRLVSRLIEHLGGMSCVVHQAGRARRVDAWRRRGCTRAVLMTREQKCQQASHLARFERGEIKPGRSAAKEHKRLCVDFCAVFERMRGMSLLVVSYADLVKRPEKVGRGIAEHCGLEWRGWPEEVVDGDAKYR